MLSNYQLCRRIENKIEKKFSKVRTNLEEIIELKRELDLKTGYYEKTERIKLKRFGITDKTKCIVGYITYVEDFLDEDMNEVVSITRTKICSIDGIPCNENKEFYKDMTLSELKYWI